MQLIDERCADTSSGGILYDAAQLRKADETLFGIDTWAAKGAVEQFTGGRGSVALLNHEGARWVLRHYRRGGMMAKLSQDRYIWTGADRTRSFREWRLLAELHRLGLPAPKPIAARYVRHGLTYTADLITAWVPHAQTLADAVTNGRATESLWREVGGTLAAFHRAGVHHADLNAHNILLQTEASSDARRRAQVSILDFDRGRIRARGAWEQQVLARLRRSLEKISAETRRSFDQQQWSWMLEGYTAAIRD